MNRSFRILPAIAAVAIAGLLVAAAEDKEPAPKMSLVIVETVKPSMTKQYEQATKEMCALLTEHHADPALVGFWTVSGPELGYAYIVPLPDGFASMKTTRENWMTTIDSIGKDRWKALAATADACVESRAMVHSVYREDLSYVPKSPSLEEKDIGFVNHDFLYTYPSTEDEFQEIAKAWKALYASKGITTGWHVYEQITGEDLPVYLVVEVAKSELDYYKTRAAVHEQLGEAAEELGQKSGAVIRKVETMAGYPRPDLSYPTMVEK